MLRMDHSSLTWLQNFKEPEGQLARWIEKLQEFNFTVIHRQGKKHMNAELEDDTTGPILRAKEADSKPDTETFRGYSRATRQLFQLWDQLVIEDGVLYREFEYFKGKPDHLQLVVPNCMRDTVLEESHTGSLGDHLGENRTLSRIREKFFWPGYAEQVRKWCRTCVRCALRKNPPKAGMVPCKVSERGILCRWWQLTSWVHHQQAKMVTGTY